MICIAVESDKKRWNTYLNIAGGSIFQRWEWKYIIEMTIGFRALFLYSCTKKGQINGILPLFINKDGQTALICSLPCTGFLELTCKTNKIAHDLLQFALFYAKKNSFELRLHLNSEPTNIPRGLQIRKLHILDYSMKLNKENHEKLDKFSPDRRWRLRRASKEGINIVPVNIEAIVDFYQIYSRSLYRLRVKPLPIELFKLVYKYFKKESFIRKSVHSGKTDATLWSFVSPPNVHMWRSGYEKNRSKFGGADLLYSNIIRFSSTHNHLQRIDAGITGMEDGAAHYKKSFGFKPQAIYEISINEITSKFDKVLKIFMKITSMFKALYIFTRNIPRILRVVFQGSLWIAEINIGLRKPALVSIILISIFIFFVVTEEYKLALILGVNIAFIFLIFCIFIRKWGIYYRITSLVSYKQRLEVVDLYLPKNMKNSLRMLRFSNDPLYNTHTAIFIDKTKIETLSCDYCRLIADVFFGEKLKKALVLGGGGGSTPLALSRNFPLCVTDVVELDEKIILLAKKYFLKGAPRINMIHTNAQVYIAKSTQKKYEFIFCDIFITTKIPSFISTDQFLQHLKMLLTKGGILIVNTGRNNAVAINILLPQIKKHFLSVHVFLSHKCFVFVIVNTKNPCTIEDVYTKTHQSRFYSDTIDFLERSYLKL